MFEISLSRLATARLSCELVDIRLAAQAWRRSDLVVLACAHSHAAAPLDCDTTHDSGFSSSTTSAQTPSSRRNALAAVSVAIDCTGTPLPSAIEDAYLPLCTASSVACRSFRLRYNQRSTGQRSLHTPFTRKGQEPGDSTLIEGTEPESTASQTLCVDCIVYPQSPPVQHHCLQPNT